MTMNQRGAHRDKTKALLKGLSRYEMTMGRLPGITDPKSRETFIYQVISSLRRVDYIVSLHRLRIDINRTDPKSTGFDPLKGAIFMLRRGSVDEAVWLTFAATHFGKHVEDGWKLASNILGSFGHGPVWTAKLYRTKPAEFDRMLQDNLSILQDPRRSGRYSNHRQYQSKRPEIISRVFRTFYAWQFEIGGFSQRIRDVHKQVGQEPAAAFDALYRSMNPIYGFGRLGRFDFLAMIGKLQLAPIAPGSVYLPGATGPLAGAKLMFHGSRNYPVSAKALGESVDQLDEFLLVGKQTLEDSLCNWQKSPTVYVYFRG